jgi:hypothetical protein
MIFASADYDGLELRTVAQVCKIKVGFSRLLEALNAGKDPHVMLGANIVGTSYEDAMARLEQKDKVIKDARQLSKPGNFGYAGGLGWEKFIIYARKQFGVIVSEKQSKDLKRTWLQTWPEFHEYFRQGKAAQERDEPLVHLFSGRVRGGLWYCSRLNSPFQGLGADATGNAAFLLAQAQYVPGPCYACSGAANGCEWCRPCHGPGISPLYGSRCVNYVHDEFIAETCEAWGHEVSHELVRVMVAGAGPYLPDVPPTAKPLLSRYWSKDAEQVWQDDPSAPGGTGKRLVAWPLSEAA